MKKALVPKIILVLCGLVFLLAGSLALFAPEAFTARNGIDIAGNISLYNDYRGFGGLLVGGGIVILLGAFISRLSYASALAASVLFLGFGLGRVVSIGLDGMPVEGMVKAAVVEIVIGLLAVFALVRYRE